MKNINEIQGNNFDVLRKRWQKKLSFCSKSSAYLSNYEREFLASVALRLASGVDLTWKQSVTLNRIYEKVVKRVG